MYEDRNHVRDIVNKVRTSQVEHEKGIAVSNRKGMQLATYYHHIIARQIDEEYELMLSEKNQLKRG